MAYSKKAEAQKAAKEAFGDDWKTLVVIQKDDEGQWVTIPEIATVLEKTAFTLAEALAESGETISDLVDTAPAPKAPSVKDSWRLSTTEKPTKKVWTIASSMPGASRKEVILACEAAGIGAGTSRTQYQAWFTATKNSGIDPRAAK